MRLVVKKSKIRGAGLALQTFPPPTWCWASIGGPHDNQTRRRRYTWRVDTDDGSVYIDAAQNDCPLRFVNGAKTERQHERINCKTCISHGALLYVTTRAVKAGEELIVDYGPYYGRAIVSDADPTTQN